MLNTKDEITGKKVGTVSVSMYEENFTGIILNQKTDMYYRFLVPLKTL